MNFTAKDKLTLALTGGICCGKSAALDAFKACGVYTLSCDELVREISQRPAVKKQIAALFGTDDRAVWARETFENPARRKALENLLHPRVLALIGRRLKAAPQRVRAVEVPLLFEAKLEGMFDLTVAVLAPQDARAERAKGRGLSAAQLRRRTAAQMTQRQKAARADVTLLNASSLEDLQDKVCRLCGALEKIYNVT